MALRINTNIAALNAHKNMIKNDNGLSSSLEKLSSGLRINRAADDASGMAIADSLKSQALGLGQAIRNANDGISMVQTADGALEESINIVNTIKTKAIQAAQDGQTTESRKAIQSDINKLMEELNIIAKTTAFNNQKLLSGNFTNKQFQVGAYSGETVNISINSTEANKIGHVTSGKLELTDSAGGTVQLQLYSSLQDKYYTLEKVDVGYNNDPDQGMGGLADAINKLSDVLGISASAKVSSTSNQAVAAGNTGSSFTVNGVVIGDVSVESGDANGALRKAINAKSSEHGVTASVNTEGYLTLTAADGRGIEVGGDLSAVLGTSDMSTLGYIELKQSGANEVVVSALGVENDLSFTANIVNKDDIVTSYDSTLLYDSTDASTLKASSIVAAGSTIGADFTMGTEFTADIITTEDSTIAAGSTIASTSVVAAGSTFGGSATVAVISDTTDESILGSGTKLETGTVIAAGTLVNQDIDLDADGTTDITSGTVLQVDSTIASGTVTLSASMTLTAGSTIGAGSEISKDSILSEDATLTGDMVLLDNMELKSGSTIDGDTSGTNTVLKAGSVIGGEITLVADVSMTQDMTLAAGSTIKALSDFANGTVVGGDLKLNATVTVKDDTEAVVAEGSVLKSTSKLTQGTVVTTDMWIEKVGGGDDFFVSAGTKLEQDYQVARDVTLKDSMYLQEKSTIAADSVLAGVKPESSDVELNDSKLETLSEIDVLTQEGAQQAIALADSALKDLDKVRSDLGSVQNQLTSTISNLSVTRVNIFSAESSIRDVDFAEEAANFSKMQILNQAGSFAMSQANASSQNVLSLLQG